MIVRNRVFDFCHWNRKHCFYRILIRVHRLLRAFSIAAYRCGFVSLGHDIQGKHACSCKQKYVPATKSKLMYFSSASKGAIWTGEYHFLEFRIDDRPASRVGLCDQFSYCFSVELDVDISYNKRDNCSRNCRHIHPFSVRRCRNESRCNNHRHRPRCHKNRCAGRGCHPPRGVILSSSSKGWLRRL